MTATDTLTACVKARITLAAEGDSLTFEAPAGAMTPAIREALTANKAHLLPIVARLAAMRINGTRCDGSPDRPPTASAKWPHHGAMGICCSCGDALAEPRSYGRCDPCQCAAEAFYSECEARSGDAVADV